MAKKFTQTVLIQELFELFQMTKSGQVEPEVSNAASTNAREIGRQLNLQFKQAELVAKEKYRKAKKAA